MPYWSSGFAESWKGQLNFVADIVIWDHDLQAIEPEEMGNVAPRYTICGGHVTYAA